MPDAALTIITTQAKSWLLSKTIWTNVIAAAATFAGAHHLPISPDEQANVLVGVLALLNIALRFVTTKAIALKLPAPQITPTVANTLGALALAFALTSVWACAAQTPAQQLYALNAGYGGALTLADAYVGLPPCGSPGATAVCKQASVVAELQNASNAADAALATAAAVIAAHGDTAKAVAAAQGALNLLLTIITPLPAPAPVGAG